MEIVVLNSDIARLVLDYLKSQKLKKATHIFCKTSPYLKQEFSAYKQGLQTHSFFPELEEIICEYVKISRKVEQLQPKLIDSLRSQLQQCKLSEKVNSLLDRAMQAILNSDDIKNSISPAVDTQSSSAADEENVESNAKRKRSFENTNNSSNAEAGTETNRNKRHKMSSPHLKHNSKKKHVLQPYCFLNTNALQRHKRRYNAKGTITTTDEDVAEEESESTSFEDDDRASDVDEVDDKDYFHEKEIFDGGRPTKESTPRTKSIRKGELVDPILPGISQAIMSNPEFQQKLVENINQALNHSGSINSNIDPKHANGIEHSNASLKDIPTSGEEITSSQLLDQMVKNILDATEKEPSFDAIIQEVVDASNKPQVQTTAVQCNINNTNLAAVGNIPLYTATEPPPLVPAHPVTQLQQYSASISPAIGTVATPRNIMNMPTTILPPPRTPIILRSAAGTTAANTSANNLTGLSAQDPPSMLTSNSFGPLIDPNFSISKYIVLNSNDSAQKQLPESSVGNTTADNLISQISTSGIADLNDEQVYFDTSTGQVAFPIFITNDGLVTNFPIVINNEYVSTQLQTNNMGNIEGSRLEEIPLSEPIVVNTNQLPSDSIGSTENVPETAEKDIKATETKHPNTVPPASQDNRMSYDKSTPSTNGIVNNKAFRSLSTPRKRTSHVRTLTFSPRNPQPSSKLTTPLTTRRDVICRFPTSVPKIIPEEVDEKTEANEPNPIKPVENTSEKAVIKAVEILPSLVNTASEILAETTNISSNDSGNIPPLFINEESSNQTIINNTLPASKETLKDTLVPKALTAVPCQTDNTPRRKQIRKSALRSCKRQLTKSSNEHDELEEKPEKENEKTTLSKEQDETRPTKTDMMAEWLRLRNSNVELDVRLREINASTQTKQIKKVNTKKKVRRKKSAAVKKKEKELVAKAEELERCREQKDAVQAHNKQKSCVENEKNAEINVEDSKLLESDTHDDNVKGKNKSKKTKKPKEKEYKSEESDKHTEDIPNIEAPFAICPVPSASPVTSPQVSEALEREKRTTNIAFLLETPFKDPNLACCNPPTPGIFAPSLDTPSGKLRDDEMLASASFLFGSVTKSELDTPLASAITPGFRLTPFGLKDIATPKSLTGTDYSSGGSYYKPDESEDLDRNIDKMLRNSAQKKTDIQEANSTVNVGQSECETLDEQRQTEHSQESTCENDKIEIEIPVEKLKIEPIVLKRVKSFGSEAVDFLENTKIDPHYTLASGLPEISAAEEECSSSSSSSSGSSSSSKSSSSSCSSSSSSSSSSGSDSSLKSKTVVETTPPNKIVNINDLENLSDISSTEDEEWQKLAVTDNDENSQLVGNDGEVRYPVRSWLTPVKENITIETKTVVEAEFIETVSLEKTSSIKVTLPLKSAEKRNKQAKELELKKERMKEKLKNDANTIIKKDKPTTSTASAPNISAALAASRMMHAMRDKGKKPACYQLPHSLGGIAVETAPTVQENRSLDVLTALNLSAKKHLPTTPESPQKTTREDNALTNSPNNLKGKSKVNISPSMTNKTPQRKCLPIEARPVTRTIRKPGKKIVRTPLAFKIIHSPGKINSHSTTTTLAELAATKTINKGKEAGIPIVSQTLRVSPRLMKPSKLSGNKQPESPTPKSKAITKNIKTKTAVAKSKITKSQNPKKESTKASLENKLKKPLKNSNEELLENRNVEELEDQIQQKSAVPMKPKINLKARNAMISTKQKNVIKKEERVVATKVETQKTEKKALEEREQLSESTSKISCVPPPTPSKSNPQTLNLSSPSTKEDERFDDDDDDPLQDCKMTTIDETDTRRFIKCVYNGPDSSPTVVPQQYDFSSFQMVVAIDENEKHIWRITEGISLFSCAPSSSKSTATISKNRKVRATIMNENALAAVPTSEATTSKTKIAAIKGFSTNVPAATSTPVVQTSINKTVAEDVKKSCLKEEGWSKSKPTTKHQPAESNKKILPETSNETPKIQIEDIESILSHLHGT